VQSIAVKAESIAVKAESIAVKAESIAVKAESALELSLPRGLSLDQLRAHMGWALCRGDLLGGLCRGGGVPPGRPILP